MKYSIEKLVAATPPHYKDGGYRLYSPEQVRGIVHRAILRTAVHVRAEAAECVELLSGPEEGRGVRETAIDDLLLKLDVSQEVTL